MANKAAVKTLMTAPIMAAVMASRSVRSVQPLQIAGICPKMTCSGKPEEARIYEPTTSGGAIVAVISFSWAIASDPPTKIETEPVSAWMLKALSMVLIPA